MQHKSISVIFISLFLFSCVVSGQKQVNSPYSRFNIGTIESVASFKSLGMGGLGIGVKSNNSVFFSNPASYSSIDTISFIFDIGIDYGLDQLTTNSKDFTSQDMNFDHLMMGFPLAKGWGVALGVVPVSSGYYKMAETVLEGDPGYDPLVGAYSSIHNGEGGFNNLFVGTGINIAKNLSLGVNMSLMFGQVKRYYQVTFSDYGYVYHNLASEKLLMHGINFEYGLHYNIPLKNDYFINTGISLSGGKNYNTNYEQLSYKYTAYNTRDTISIVTDDSTTAFIPGTLGVGFTFGKKNKFMTGIDYVMTKWSNARIPGPGNYAADSRSFRFGFEYIPDKYSNYSLLKRIEYRAGAHYGDSYLIIQGEQVKEAGFSFGIGLPMKRSPSRTNFYFDYTKKYGPAGSIIHTEHYYTMGLSLNLYDWWFIKRKYE